MFKGEDAEKDAFYAAIEEYNLFGVWAHNSKYKLEQSQAVAMYGFKVTWQKYDSC